MEQSLQQDGIADLLYDDLRDRPGDDPFTPQTATGRDLWYLDPGIGGTRS